MEIYVLDSDFQREAVVDKFESLVWSERITSYGDFELSLQPTHEMKTLFSDGRWIAINKSNRIMRVENSEDVADNDGKFTLKITGRSAEAILEERAVFDVWATQWGTETPVWVLTGTPVWILNHIFDVLCRGTYTPTPYINDTIPKLAPGTFYPPSTLPFDNTEVRMEIPFSTVYATLKEICESYSLAFRLVRDPVTTMLHFDIYTGNDRTATQSVNDPVIFDSDLNNLTNITHFRSSADYRNVAYVINRLNNCHMVYADDASDTVAGFNRRVLMLDATNVEKDPLDDDFFTYLEQLGKEALTNHNRVAYLDGEIPFNTYRYELDYYLNDIVDMVGEDGSRNRMRVVEQIFTDDAEGERSYPTLALDAFVTPGSWYDWPYAIPWNDATGSWDDQSIGGS